MVYPENFSVAKLVLVHRVVNDNLDYVSRLHILQSGSSTLITVQCAIDKLIQVYRHDGGVYIVMEDNKSGESSYTKCNAVSRNVSSDTLLSVPTINSNEDNHVRRNRFKRPRAIGELMGRLFNQVADCFGNLFNRRKALSISTSSTDVLRSSELVIDKPRDEDDTSSVGRKLYDFQKSSCHDLRMDNLPFNVETYTLGRAPHSFSVDPQSCLYITWLTIVTLAYLYNCVVIPLRNAFPYQTPNNTSSWLFWDYLTDLIYLMDVIVVKPRIKYLDDGFWIEDPELTKQHYTQKLQYKMDVLSLLPLDVLYLKFGTAHCYFRLPRLLKIQTFWEFFDFLDNYTSSSCVIRVTRTLTYMLYLVHLNTCAYYAVSVYEGIGSNVWVYNGEGNAYIRCFYRATKTAACIGKNPKPSTEIEYLFMTVSWLMGVFVFAILIGQIRDIIATASKAQTEYRKLVDETLEYLRKLNVPEETRSRVEQWFSFTWEQQHTLDETKILDSLPHKLKTDVAINVHFKTISKVELFEHCEEALLRDLVLKLKPVLFLPGDFICRKGEVGREMYIVKTGQVQVVGGDDGDEVLATLTEGSVFGEVSLLNLADTNRRTADVKSNGFSSLFVLKKNDLKETIQYYPNAEERLKQKAIELMKRNTNTANKNSVFEIPNRSDSDEQSEESTAKLLVKKYFRKRKKTISTSFYKKKKSLTKYISRYKRQSRYRSSKIHQHSRLMYYIRKQRRKKSKGKNVIYESDVVLE